VHVVTDVSKLRAMGEERPPAGAFARPSGVSRDSQRKAERGGARHGAQDRRRPGRGPEDVRQGHLTPPSIEPQDGFTGRGIFRGVVLALRFDC
jgi:hypothetical protein